MDAHLLFVRRLKKEEKDFLLGVVDDKKNLFAYRARIILLSYNGYTPKEIGIRLNMHPTNIRKWIRRFNSFGIKGLFERRRAGRKPKFDKGLENLIARIARKNPYRLGLPYTAWSFRKLKRYLEKKKIVKSISVSELRRILLSRNIASRKSRRKLISEDPDYEAKKRRLNELLEKPNCILLFFDEKGPTVIKRYGGRKLTNKKFVVIKANQKLRVKKKMYLFAAYNPHKDRIYYKFYYFCTSREFREFVLRFRKRFEDFIYVIIDNGPIHIAKMVKKIEEEFNDIELFYLPKSSPELNPLENKFNLLQSEIISNSNFRSTFEMKRAIARWVRSYNNRRRI